MESQLGVALVGPTSCTSCLWFFCVPLRYPNWNRSTARSEVLKLSPSTWADQEWSCWAKRSKFLLGQLRRATCGRSPTEGVAVAITNKLIARIMHLGEVHLCTWSLRALFILDHTCHSWNPKPFLILSRLPGCVRVMSHFFCWIHFANLVRVIALLFSAAVGLEFVSQRLGPIPT